MDEGLNLGWAATVLQDRGFRGIDRDALRDVLSVQSDAVRAALRTALRAGASGTEDRDGERLLRALAGASARQLPPPLADLGRSAAFLRMAGLSGGATQGERASGSDECGALDDGFDYEADDVDGDADRAVELSHDTAPPANGAATRSPGFVNYHVHGTTGALCVEVDRVRKDPGGGRGHTLVLEAAPSRSKRPDWAHKIAFQLTAAELPIFAGVALGSARELKLAGHGVAKTKWLKVERQEGKLFVQVGDGKRVVSVPVGPGDAYHLGALCLRALLLNDPQLGAEGVLCVVRAAAALQQEVKPEREGRPSRRT